MKRTPDSKTIWVFTPSRTDPKDLEFILVQRQELLQDAVDRVRESALTEHKHHLLFVGPRGCGKTHLVTLIVSRLSDDDELTDRLRIAWLNEDETCTSLLEFLLKIHAALEKRYPGEYRDEMLAPAYEMKPDAAVQFVAKSLLTSLSSRTTLLVVTENLDAIFEGLGDAGQKQLRAFIQENPRLAIVATAQRLVDDLSRRTSPFFGFFQTEHLKPLNVDEATKLLQNIASLHGESEVVEFLSTSRGRSRVRALHHLSGGNHRIYIVLSQFITRDSIDALVEPFMKMVDELTPYYQERIRWLPTLQRKIVELLCKCEGTVPVKEIAKRLFSTPQTISSQLQDLREKGYVEANQRGRESLYEISEPLMRICVEVKENQTHQPLRLLVDFLRVWYDDKQLNQHLEKMEAASASRAYVESALQRNSAEGNLRKQVFLKELNQSLPKHMDQVARTKLIRKCEDMPEAIALSIKNWHDGDADEARMCLDEAIEEESNHSNRGKLLFTRGQLRDALGDHKNAIEDYTSAICLPDVPVDLVADALFNRGLTYSKIGNTERALEDYTATIELPGAPLDLVAKALVNRAIIHNNDGRVHPAMEDYTAVIELLDAPAELVAVSFVNRGVIHNVVGSAQRAIEDYSEAIGLADAPVEQVAIALINRGITHGSTGNMQSEIADYTKLIELPGALTEHIAIALLNRGVTHGQLGDIGREIEDYTATIELPGAPNEQVAKALVNRGITYSQSDNTRCAIKDYTAAIELFDAPVEQVAKALFNRGSIYSKAGETQRADSDYNALIGLSGAPVGLVARAFINRGIARVMTGDRERAIDDYTSVIGLSGAPVALVSRALLNRGVTLLQMGAQREAQTDLEAVMKSKNAPEENIVDALFALSKLHWKQGQWTEGFNTLQESLERGSHMQPPYYPTATSLMCVMFFANLSSEALRTNVAELLGMYAKNLALPVLSEAVVELVGEVFRGGEPWPSNELEEWVSSWEQAAESVSEFRLASRMLRTGVEFVKAGGKNPGILLDLSSAERSILQQALGLEESQVAS